MSRNCKEYRLYRQRCLRKNEEVAKLQDLLVYACKGVSEVVTKGHLDVTTLSEVNHEVLKSLFITITNANFDEAAIEKQIQNVIRLRDELKQEVSGVQLGGMNII